MAWVVLKAAKLLFPRRYAWMFTALVVFLPGNVILYSYVNCDALAMCSTAIIFYSWVKAYKEGWNWTTCAVSAIGMGLCFLSYYNAYGFILTTFFFFVGTMLTDQEKAPKERWKEMIQKGLFILGDRLCHCFVVVYSKCNSLSTGIFWEERHRVRVRNCMRELSTSHRTAKHSRKKATPCYV